MATAIKSTEVVEKTVREKVKVVTLTLTDREARWLRNKTGDMEASSDGAESMAIFAALVSAGVKRLSSYEY